MLSFNLMTVLYCVLLVGFAAFAIFFARFNRCLRDAVHERALLKVYGRGAWSDASIDMVPVTEHAWAIFLGRSASDLYPPALAAAARKLGID